MRTAVLLLAISPAWIVGCGKTVVDHSATTVAECAAQYNANPSPQTLAAYQQCLTMIGANVPQAAFDDPTMAAYLEPVGEQRQPVQLQAPSLYCTGGSSFMQGGAGYCIGGF